MQISGGCNARKYVWALAAVAMLVGPAAWAQTVQVHGSTTVKAALVGPNQKDIEAKSGQTLEVVGNGSGRGLIDLAGGKADVAMISAPLEEVVAKVNGKTPGALSAEGLKAVEVGKTQVAFIVNPGVKVGSLTLSQVHDLLDGKISNWKDVGGADGAVVVVCANPGDGIRTVCEEGVLGKDAMSKDARTMNSALLVVQAVAQLPGAIGITSAAGVTDKVSVVKTDKDVSATLYLVTKGEPTAAAKKVIDAVKEIGGK